MVTKSQTAIGAYGFGPNVSNPITGKVEGATANVWVSSVLDGYITKVRQYIRIKIWPPAWKFFIGFKRRVGLFGEENRGFVSGRWAVL